MKRMLKIGAATAVGIAAAATIAVTVCRRRTADKA